MRLRLRRWCTIAMGMFTTACAAAGCTMDFDRFASGSDGCGSDEKRCGDACVSTLDPAFGCGGGCAPCDVPNASAVCAGGACAVAQCVSGYHDCDADPATGCESDTAIDPLNCGACGGPCMIPHATPGCDAGECTLASCDPGYADCDGALSTGCEIQTAVDPANCGGCGLPCNPFQTCQGGMCVLICDPGTDDCDGDPGNGCETQLGTLTNCTGCGDACAFPNATEACLSTGCAIAACDDGFGDCDMAAANGCEIHLDTDVAHCGACPNACPSGPNSTPVCSAGTCGLLCMGTFQDCDGSPSTGCEVDVATTVGSCGACFRACSPANAMTLSCVGGLCAPACSPGYGNCSQPAAPAPDDGCERDLMTDVGHCGACGRACSVANVASRSCSGGLCDSTCDLGYGNCTQPAAPAGDNGCELNTQQNDANCGGCGNSCALQGGTNAFECDQGGMTQRYCGCNVDVECDTDGNGPAQGICGIGGLCACDGTTCAPGEDCVFDGVASICSCNDLAACGPGMTCCQTPGGCVDLATDAQSCGACGRACAAGFACAGGSCRCDAAADCDAGTGGAFSCDGQGRCVCGVTTCAPGERCQPNGQCG